MLIRAWRKSKRLSIRDGAETLGISFGYLSKLENGLIFPDAEIITQIEAATAGAVTVVDHFKAWQRASLEVFKAARLVGWTSARAARRCSR